MSDVVCSGLCGLKFNREKAIANGQMYETGICHDCYATWAENPSMCFGKEKPDGSPLADINDPTCAACPEYPVCVKWKDNIIAKEDETMVKEKGAATEVAEGEFVPLEEPAVEASAAGSQGGEQAAAAAAPSRSRAPSRKAATRTVPRGPKATARTARSAAAPQRPAPRKASQKAATRPAPARAAARTVSNGSRVSPYLDGTARDVMFRKLLSGWFTKEEVIAEARKLAKHPERVFAENFWPNRNRRDSNEQYFKWEVKEKGGKLKIFKQ